MVATNTLSLSILAIGAIASLPLFVSGVEDLTDKPAPYMATQPLQYDRESNLVTQSHLIGGATNMPATWFARITAPDGTVLCEGNGSPMGSSYTNRERSSFSPSVWSGGDCPAGPLEDGTELWARWEYLSNGQRAAVEKSCIVGESCADPS